MEIRKRNVPEVEYSEPVKLVKSLQRFDAFPKLPPECQESSIQGASISIITFLFIGILVVSETFAFFDSKMNFTYEVDKDFNSKIKINIDITVAMKCQHIGADVVDTMGHSTESDGQLEEMDVNFELSSTQASYFSNLRAINGYLRTEHHAIQHLLWKRSQFGFMAPDFDSLYSNKNPVENPNACRLKGTFLVNKVAGNFHITAGKNLPIFGAGGHAHIALFMSNSDYNYTHRINHFSFGNRVSGTINPLDAEEFITTDPMEMYQYFVQVVPTSVNTRQAVVDTYQFSVTEKSRPIDHNTGSHGIPGIFFKYDISALKVNVKEEFQTLTNFLVRLAAIVGGVFATSAMLKQACGFLFDTFTARFRLGAYKTAPLDLPKHKLPNNNNNM